MSHTSGWIFRNQWIMVSLVPRLFPPRPGRKGHVCDVRLGGCPIIVTHKLCVDQSQVYQTTSCIDAVFLMLQSQDKKDFGILCRALPSPPSPPHVYPHIYLMSRTRLFFPGLPLPFFAYCKRSKTGGGNGLGTWLDNGASKW